jgi:hypothetical protein
MNAMRNLALAAAAVVALAVAGTAYGFSQRGPSEPNQAADSAPAGRGHTPALQQEDDASEPGVAGEPADDDSGENGAERHADLLAAEFGLSRESVLALHQQGIGWGGLFKLCSMARAMNVPVETLIANAAVDTNGEREFAFGELKQTLTPEQLADLDSGPKNFGQVVSASNRHDGHHPGEGRGPAPLGRTPFGRRPFGRLPTDP